MPLRPTPMMMRPPGLGGPPRLPGSPMGGPGGPGPTPMTSPGAGAGAKAAAVAKVKEAARMLLEAARFFDVGSKELNAIMSSTTKLNPVFGKAQDTDLGPAARAQMAQPPPSPLAGMAPTGMAGGGGGPPPGPPVGPSPGDMGGGNPAFP